MSALSQPANRAERVVPWISLTLAPLAWVVFEYGLATSLRASCAAVGTWLGFLWGGGSLLVCAVAVGLSWRMAWTVRDDPPTRPWLARIACVMAGIFALAIAFQTLATAIVPSCAR